jgi:hypothetical protein
MIPARTCPHNDPDKFLTASVFSGKQNEAPPSFEMTGLRMFSSDVAYRYAKVLIVSAA